MATPASLRIGIGVVPAWFWMPLKVRRKTEMPTIAVTIPICLPLDSRRPPCSI